MTNQFEAKYPEVNDIKHGLESLKDSTLGLAKRVKENSSEHISEATDSLKAQAKVEMERAEQYVKEKPLQGLAIAFAGGLLASYFLRR